MSIEFCGSARGGDAGSGVAIVGDAADHRLVRVTSRHNAGAGFAISAAVKGDGTPGTPMLTEVPTSITLEECIAAYNAEEGIRALGPHYLRLVRNHGRENSQRGNGLFKELRLEPLGPGADLYGLECLDNSFDGGCGTNGDGLS